MANDMAPVPSPVVVDPGEVGSIWRTQKFETFRKQAAEIGAEDDTEYQSLLAAIAAHTAALDRLWQSQKDLTEEMPWWADGEYDSERADRENDAGMSAYNLGRHGEAFQHFSEAIRLSPGNCIYHANRASAALHVGRADVALQDAKNAVERDAGYCKAYLRGGAAAMALQRPHEALPMYQQALQLKPGSRAAKAGCRAAATMAEQQRSAAEMEGRAALCGERPALLLAASDDEAAAEQLLSAEAMLQACPGLHAAKCAHVEALILCQRYTDAHSACESLLPGVDKLYLEAQAGWRTGSLKEALAALQAALALMQDSPKCSQLMDLVTGVMQHDDAAAAALEEGREEECMKECSAALQLTEHCSCAGLRCRLLYRRGRAYSAASRHEEALSDCAAALQLDPAHADCLHLRHQVHRDMGNYVGAFLDLQRLRKVAPKWPGLLQLLEETAALSLGNRGNHHVAAGSFYEILQIPVQASPHDIRRAYRMQASKWHPDKWVNATEDDALKAKEKYMEVALAYDTLGHERGRCVYNARVCNGEA